MQILVLKRMLECLLKVPPLKKILEFPDWKKDYETSTKKKIPNQKLNQWLKTYKMDVINYKTNKQKVLNFVLTFDGNWRSKNAQKSFSKVPERQILQNQTISELYTDDNKSKYYSHHKNILKSVKKFMKNFAPRRQLRKLLLLNFSANFLTDRKYLLNNITFVRRKYI